MSQEVLGILRDLNLKISQSQTKKEKAQLIFNYIDISFHNSGVNIEELYIKAKLYINLITDSFSDGNIYYDQIKLETFYKIIFKFPIEHQKHLLNHLLHKIKINNFDHLIDDIDSTINKVEYRFSIYELKKSKSFSSILNYLICAVRYNYISVFVSLLFCFLLTYILTFTWESAPIHLFEIKPLQLSENIYLNHLANILMMIFDLNDDKYIIPINFFGAVVLVLLKLFNVFIIFGYLWKLLKTKLSN